MKNIFFLLVLLVACQSKKANNIYNVSHRGALKQMMHKGDISAKIDLTELKNLQHVYAIGAVENLKGEVMIYDGLPMVTSVSGQNAKVDNTHNKKATLLVWAQVPHWTSISVPNNIKSYEDLESFIKSSATDRGMDMDSPFPFLLDGNVASVDWHIINWKDGDTEHSHDKHIQSGLQGRLKNIPVNMLGFYSNHHRAVFTHHTTNIHTHFMTSEAPYAGHADDLTLGEDMILKLPISNYTLIENATILDVDNLGKTTNDVTDACLLIKDDHIQWIGQCDTKPEIPKGTTIIDATSKYVMPGLFDGFAAINKQAYCNAYLYSGVTSIISVDGGRRGVFYGSGSPSPNIYRLEGVGSAKIDTDTLLARLDELHDEGYKVMLLMYGLTPDQIVLAIEKSKKHGMVTIGEMGYTTYKEGMDSGLDAIVHTTRYSLDVAPRDMARAVADHPFSNDLNSAKWKYYKYLTKLDKSNPALLAHAKNIGTSNTFIIPTSSLSYLDIEDHKNPWDEPIASILTIDDINRPADPKTGKHSIDAVEQAAYSNLINNELINIEPTYYKNGAKYLAGSGTDVWGTMPGISLHTELWLLHHKIGLSKREVLAAATTNFSKAFDWNNGKLEIGFAANIIILNKNPLENLEYLKDIDKVILNGEEVDREALLVTPK